MTIDFFYENYNLLDYDLKYKVMANKVYLTLYLQAHIDYVANGYRLELDINQAKTFVFDVINNENLKCESDHLSLIKCEDNYYFVINNSKLLIVNSNIVIQ